MSILREAPAELIAALEGGVALQSADLFEFDLIDGETFFYWTSWAVDLIAGANTYSSRAPWLKRSQWNLTNTMAVPDLKVYLMALNDGFNGGANIKAQIHDGLFDGAAFILSRAFMTTPGDPTTVGTIGLFSGEVGAIDIIGSKATVSIKGKTNKLAQNAPRNLYQAGCNLNFCGTRCTLDRATFTASFTVGSSPTATFIPWSGTPPGNVSNYIGGTVTITGADGEGQRRTVFNADSTGLTLIYPLYVVPAPGDSFDAFQGCDKTFNSGSGRSCSDRSNSQNYDGFEFIPPPSAGV